MKCQECNIKCEECNVTILECKWLDESGNEMTINDFAREYRFAMRQIDSLKDRIEELERGK